MIQLYVGCKHRTDPLEILGVQFIEDLTGLPIEASDESAAMIVQVGGIPLTGVNGPSFWTPCWRCQYGDGPELRSRVADAAAQQIMPHETNPASPASTNLTRSANASTEASDVDFIAIVLVGLERLGFATPQRDEHGRTDETVNPFADPILSEHPWQIYVIDQFLESIDQAARAAGQVVVVKPRWPDDQSWAFALSHDVDHVRKWQPQRPTLRLLEAFRAIRRCGKFGAPLNSLARAYIGPLLTWRDPYRNLDEIGEFEHGLGARSTFLFGIANPGYSQFEISYPTEDLNGVVNFTALRQLGHEIALHGSYQAADEIGRLSIEKAKIEELSCGSVSGVRQHYLRFDWERIFREELRAGFLYDASWGFSRSPGFRGGLGLPLWVSSQDRTNPNHGLVELPMTIMDTSLREHLRLNPEQAAVVAQRILANAAASGGLVVANWHNNAYDREDSRFGEGFVRRLIDEARVRGAWQATLSDLAEWWSYRRTLQISLVDGSIRISNLKSSYETSFDVLGNPDAIIPNSEILLQRHPTRQGRLRFQIRGGRPHATLELA